MTHSRPLGAGPDNDAAVPDDPPFDLPEAPRAEPQAPRSISQRAVAAPGGPPAYLADLNPEQREAVETTEGPLLVLAGAGTGKTRVLTTRIAHILASARAYPSQILAVTFTNKAAREMKDRIGALIGGAVEGMAWLGTFHAIGVKILRRHCELVGLKSGFTILDADDQLRLMRQVIEAAGIDKERWPARQLANLIDGWKNRGLTPDRIPASDASAFAGRGRELYAAYQARLKDLNACDFGDLLLECLRLFRERPDVLADFHRRFRYILVDEYQDTNVAQYLWLRLLAQGCPNVCCVGDDDQSIYGWRGAEVDNILRFDKDFAGAKIIRLERNYRSTGHILAAASALIAHNESRLGKTLFTDDAMGEKVAVANFWDDEAEARSIGDDIENLQRAGSKLSDVAVLVRASFQMRVIEDRFITLGLPYRVIGGPRFYERQEIKDAIAYLEVVANPANDLKFERVVNVPKRGLGDTTLNILHEHARYFGMPLMSSADRLSAISDLKPSDIETLKNWPLPTIQSQAEVDEPQIVDGVYLDESELPFFSHESGVPRLLSAAETLRDAHSRRFGLTLRQATCDLKFAARLSKRPKQQLGELVQALAKWRSLLGAMRHTDLAEKILDESGYTAMWQADKSPQAQSRLENLKELVRFMHDFETLAGFLEHVALVMDADQGADGDRASLMTLHAAKGLEFANVFLPGWEEGLFPHQRALDDNGKAGLEEERRLAYVGVTRAKRFAKISFAQNRRNRGLYQSAIPSRFVDELPEAHVEVMENTMPYGGISQNYGFNNPYGASRFDRAAEAQPFASSYRTPGWQRAQQTWSDDRQTKRRRGPMTLEGELVAASTASAPDFKVGTRVHHEKFGAGSVTLVDGNKLTIAFDDGSTKRVVASFVDVI